MGPIPISHPMSDHQGSSFTPVLSYIQPTSWMLSEPTPGCSLSLNKNHTCLPLLDVVPISPASSITSLFPLGPLQACGPLYTCTTNTLLNTVHRFFSYSDLVHILNVLCRHQFEFTFSGPSPPESV